MPATIEKTRCYTYKINMVVQILAKDLPTAAERLNSVGGHVTSREVELLSTTDLPTGPEKSDSDKKLKSL